MQDLAQHLKYQLEVEARAIIRNYLGLQSSEVRCQSKAAAQRNSFKGTRVYCWAGGVRNAADEHVRTLLIVSRLANWHRHER